MAHGGHSKGESGTVRLIRTVCKSVGETRCEKSGKMVIFATYLRNKFNVSNIPLYPFLRNRLNILFLNGAGAFELYEKLLAFFDLIDKTNKLLVAVFYDLQVVVHKIGCRCLGRIHKLVTASLWRMLE